MAGRAKCFGTWRAERRPTGRSCAGDGDPARKAGPIHPRPVKHSRSDHRPEGRLPILRRMGRHYHGARPLDAHRSRTPSWSASLSASALAKAARAKANGESLGRKPKLTRHQQREAIQRRDNSESIRAIAHTYSVHPSTISRFSWRTRASEGISQALIPCCPRLAYFSARRPDRPLIPSPERITSKWHFNN